MAINAVKKLIEALKADDTTVIGTALGTSGTSGNGTSGSSGTSGTRGTSGTSGTGA